MQFKGVRVILMVGIPGSGKTHFASQLKEFIVVSRDTQPTAGAFDSAVATALASETADGHPSRVVMDMCNWTVAFRDEKLRWLQCLGIKKEEVGFVCMDTPTNICIKRVLDRVGHASLGNQSAPGEVQTFVLRYAASVSFPKPHEWNGRFCRVEDDSYAQSIALLNTLGNFSGLPVKIPADVMEGLELAKRKDMVLEMHNRSQKRRSRVSKVKGTASRYEKFVGENHALCNMSGLRITGDGNLVLWPNDGIPIKVQYLYLMRYFETTKGVRGHATVCQTTLATEQRNLSKAQLSYCHFDDSAKYGKCVSDANSKMVSRFVQSVVEASPRDMQKPRTKKRHFLPGDPDALCGMSQDEPVTVDNALLAQTSLASMLLSAKRIGSFVPGAKATGADFDWLEKHAVLVHPDAASLTPFEGMQLKHISFHKFEDAAGNIRVNAMMGIKKLKGDRTGQEHTDLRSLASCDLSKYPICCDLVAQIFLWLFRHGKFKAQRMVASRGGTYGEQFDAVVGKTMADPCDFTIAEECKKEFLLPRVYDDGRIDWNVCSSTENINQCIRQLLKRAGAPWWYYGAYSCRKHAAEMSNEVESADRVRRNMNHSAASSTLAGYYLMDAANSDIASNLRGEKGRRQLLNPRALRALVVPPSQWPKATDADVIAIMEKNPSVIKLRAKEQLEGKRDSAVRRSSILTRARELAKDEAARNMFARKEERIMSRFAISEREQVMHVFDGTGENLECRTIPLAPTPSSDTLRQHVLKFTKKARPDTSGVSGTLHKWDEAISPKVLEQIQSNKPSMIDALALFEKSTVLSTAQNKKGKGGRSVRKYCCPANGCDVVRKNLRDIWVHVISQHSVNESGMGGRNNVRQLYRCNKCGFSTNNPTTISTHVKNEKCTARAGSNSSNSSHDGAGYVQVLVAKTQVVLSVDSCSDSIDSSDDEDGQVVIAKVRCANDSNNNDLAQDEVSAEVSCVNGSSINEESGEVVNSLKQGVEKVTVNDLAQEKVTVNESRASGSSNNEESGEGVNSPKQRVVPSVLQTTPVVPTTPEVQAGMTLSDITNNASIRAKRRRSSPQNLPSPKSSRVVSPIRKNLFNVDLTPNQVGFLLAGAGYSKIGYTMQSQAWTGFELSQISDVTHLSEATKCMKPKPRETKLVALVRAVRTWELRLPLWLVESLVLADATRDVNVSTVSDFWTATCQLRAEKAKDAAEKLAERRRLKLLTTEARIKERVEKMYQKACEDLEVKRMLAERVAAAKQLLQKTGPSHSFSKVPASASARSQTSAANASRKVWKKKRNKKDKKKKKGVVVEPSQGEVDTAKVLPKIDKEHRARACVNVLVTPGDGDWGVSLESCASGKHTVHTKLNSPNIFDKSGVKVDGLALSYIGDTRTCHSSTGVDFSTAEILNLIDRYKNGKNDFFVSLHSPTL